MKKKNNIIKKIELNKVFKFNFKKGFKHFFKRSRLKNKFFFKILNNKNSFFNLIKITKYFKYNILNVNKFLIIKRYNYFNYITNGLDLKYNNLCQDISNLNYIFQFDKKKSIFLKNQDQDILKYQKFISFIDNNFIFIEDLNVNIKEYFKSSYDIFFSIILNIYITSYLLMIN